MRNHRILFVLLPIAAVLLVVVLFLLLFRDGPRNTPEVADPLLSEHDFSSSPQDTVEEPQAVSQTSTPVESGYGSDINMEFPVLEE